MAANTETHQSVQRGTSAGDEANVVIAAWRGRKQLEKTRV